MNKELEALAEFRDLLDDLEGQLDDSFTLEEVYNTIKQVLTDKNKEIQKLKIDNYQQSNLIDKYHTNDFPKLFSEIKELEEEISDRKDTEQSLSQWVINLQSKLDEIKEVVYGGFQREEIEDKIKSILKKSE